MSRGETWRDQNELRFRIERDQAVDLFATLRRESQQIAYVPGSTTTLIVTVYLDTPEGHYFQLSQDSAGKSSIKVRVREYLPLSDEDRSIVKVSRHCFLERKERVGISRTKQRVTLSKSAARDFLEGVGDELGDSDEAVAIRSELAEKTVIPRLVSVYERRVWGDDRDLRITYDERLGFHEPWDDGLFGDDRFARSEPLESPAGVGPKRILEIKHAQRKPLPDWLKTYTDQLDEFVGYSKFRDGMQQLLSKDPGAPPLTRPLILPGDS